ncbi:DNA-binding transcriptional regulator, GntR family [Actinopolymorpha cephalotaxi]|uniref:DNA-binding GntR family transcriptional regulator n=1 Tax=Actinopolymorpha cephalotaxi TaxID=504797 RepID=A0A1I2QZH6_9ACTN|nr:GntR family transcriptional regulator [Actinopolymorpha cephalotaxi]NYH82407.1 DNA-binding GntR family transcriptional regulator [Actinopolymorpha cephalotaxi]SFG33895.1 DNA-binding transcriptional regulator, GntR family [Actinopolymorpha cephalotaxi]
MNEAGRAAAEQVAEVLRARLLDGALPPGAHLSEEQLAAEFGAGRYTVRAALRTLATAGLLTHVRHRGAFVPDLTIDRVDELFGYRAVIELGALRLALAGGRDLAPVESAVADLEAVDRPSDQPSDQPRDQPSDQPRDRRGGPPAAWHDVTAAHRAVHHALVAAAGNPRLLTAYSACEDELQFLLAFARPEFTPGRLARLHQELLTNFGRGVEKAQRALADDLEVGRQGLVRALALPTDSRAAPAADSPAGPPAASPADPPRPKSPAGQGRTPR